MKTFDVLLSEKIYQVQGDKKEQTAKVIMHVFHGSWQLKEVRFTTFNRTYTRSDWRFLKDLATYVEYLCIEAGGDKLEIDVPEEIFFQKEEGGH